MSKKEKYQDDGHTIYNMDVEGMPHRRRSVKGGVDLSKKERTAITLAVMGKVIPLLLLIILCFGLAMLLIKFWLG